MATHKPLHECYRHVVVGQSSMVHALWTATGNDDHTMCGNHSDLDTTPAKAKVVTCIDCNAALKRVRQQRSYEQHTAAEEAELRVCTTTDASNRVTITPSFTDLLDEYASIMSRTEYMYRSDMDRDNARAQVLRDELNRRVDKI